MQNQKNNAQIIRFGHSPDPDDAFMFYGIAHKKINTAPYVFQDVIKDIEALNQMALHAELEATAISVHAYAHVAQDYAIMPCGASVGDRYGPVLVANAPIQLKDLPSYTIAIPGVLTTAFLVLKIFEPSIHYIVMPFDQILQAVRQGSVDAGLIIHEGQLTYMHQGLHLLLDLGRWWHEETGFPLPLGIDVIRKDLGPESMTAVTDIFRQSIFYSLSNRKDALKYALKFGRGLDAQRTDRFISMYVNHFTIDCGPEIQLSLKELLARGHTAGLYPKLPEIEFVELNDVAAH